MKFSEHIPTIFAIALAESVGLMVKNPTEPFTIEGQTKRLSAFQQMAIGCEFNACLVAYHGVELTKEQKAALEVVYTSTAPWLIGHVVAELMDDITNEKSKAAELILTQLIKDGKVDPEIGKGLIVKFQVIDEKAKIIKTIEENDDD